MTCVHFGGHGEFQIDIRVAEKNTYTFVFLKLLHSFLLGFYFLEGLAMQN